MGDTDDLLKKANELGSKKALMSDVVGMPDKEDRDFLRRLILRYERANPGYVKNAIDSARQDQRDNSTAFRDIKEFGLVDRDSSRRHLLELPETLVAQIEAHYPTMFRDRKHFAWFCKNFKELLLPEKY